MKKYLVLLCMMALQSQVFAQPPDFVKLRGRQFFDGYGLPFYPLLMNYSLEYHYENAPSTNHWLDRSWEYGTDNNAFENTNYLGAQLDILNDLYHINIMGFNMVRPDFTPEWDAVSQRFYLKGRTSSGVDQRTYFEQPFISNQNVLDYFAYLDWFIDRAGAENLYTMINGVLGDVSDPNAFIPYKEYLDFLGKHFKNNKWLAFYDILNEPLWKYSYAQASGDINFYSKRQACELVAEYYDALKNQYADPNHLISGGNLIADDIVLFDPSILKVDFSQPHLYSELFIDYDQCNLSNKMNRILGSTYWVTKSFPMPWINGETGFPSSDTEPPCTKFAQVAGTNSEQHIYADNMLNATRDYGGSGFFWWNFQDGSWPGNNVSGYGLLSLNTGIEKPAVTTFQSYLDINYQPPSPAPVSPNPPTNYYDPYVNINFNSSQMGAVTGTVLDENGNPIANACISAKNYRETHPIYGVICSWIYTYTDDNGFFKLVPYNSITPLDSRITYLIGSAAGVESFHSGINDGTQMTNPPTFYLKRIHFDYDAIFQEDVATAATKNFKGWNSLTLQHAELNGNSVLNAREEINLRDGFHASQNSEVHIFPKETFAVCSDYATFQVHNARLIQNTQEQPTTEHKKQIELEFEFVKPTLLIQPNPSQSFVTIKINNAEYSTNKKMSIKNTIGEIVKEYTFAGNEINLNLNYLPKAIYFIEVKTNKIVINSKLILN